MIIQPLEYRYAQNGSALSYSSTVLLRSSVNGTGKQGRAHGITDGGPTRSAWPCKRKQIWRRVCRCLERCVLVLSAQPIEPLRIQSHELSPLLFCCAGFQDRFRKVQNLTVVSSE